jgi:polysaccharide biosynthesis/export protein
MITIALSPASHVSFFAAPRGLRRAFAALVLPLFLMACADGHTTFPLSSDGQGALDETVEVIALDATNINSFSRAARVPQATTLPATPNWSYRVGVGDILSVIVFNQPELTMPAGPQRSAAESGFQVGQDGSFSYPFIGSVPARGRSVEAIRAEIATRLSAFIPDPQVDVRVASFNAQAVVVTGEVKSPNRQALRSVPLTLIEAANAAGGFTDAADMRAVTVQRAGRLHQVDVEGFLQAGLLQNNPVLIDGDVVNIPRRRAEEAYLLGEVAKPDVVDLSREQITLTQAITRRGGLNVGRANARGVLVFRAYESMTRVFVLDTSRPEGLLLGTRFMLEPGDVVYVLRAPLQRWNDTITRVLPTVRAIDTVQGL